MTQNTDEIDDPDYRKIAQLLDGAKGTVVDDRGDTHGHPRENLQHTADMWAAYLETDVSPTDVAMCMVMQKISRQKKGKPVEDHYEDMDGYASIGGALALNDRDRPRRSENFLRPSSERYAELLTKAFDRRLDEIEDAASAMSRRFAGEDDDVDLICEDCDSAGDDGCRSLERQILDDSAQGASTEDLADKYELPESAIAEVLAGSSDREVYGA